MSKLFKLKEWLTLDDAANHLSTVLGEPVTRADIYRLALDSHLKLSVNFVNGARGRIGKFVKTDEVKFEKVEYDIFTGEKLDEPYYRRVNQEIYVSEDHWIGLNSDVVFIKGLWDLTMIGAEALDIEHYYQQVISGMEVRLICLEGVCLSQGDTVCQLQTYLTIPGSKANKEKLEKYISNNDLSDDEVDRVRSEYEVARKKYLAGKIESEREPTYFPSASLDDYDHVLVVKTKELTRFIQSLEDTPPESKPLTSKERNSLLVLIGALCHDSDIDPSQRGISTSLVAMTELIGAPLTDDTIRKILSQIEPAIEARSK
jgi:hypothetical protein